MLTREELLEDIWKCHSDLNYPLLLTEEDGHRWQMAIRTALTALEESEQLQRRLEEAEIELRVARYEASFIGD